MGFPTRFAILGALALPVVLAGGAASDPELRYDPGTVVTVRMIVAEVRDVARDHPLPGIHVMARPESARRDSEAWDVYIGPAEFLKEIDLKFHERDKLEVVGSKLKTSGGTVILTKEIRQNGSTLYIRDDRGEPMWKAPAGGS